MTLYFTSGGGRLGNQILNLMHLMALSFEYDLKVFKLNDLFIVSKDGALMFPVNSDTICWQISKNHSKFKYFYLFFYKLCIYLLHFYFYIDPSKKSYKIGHKNNLPKFICGENLGNNFLLNRIIKESYESDVIIAGWGLRNWELVRKHKKSIVADIIEGFDFYTNLKESIKKEYLLVHIRRDDFLEIESYKDINFNDKVWMKSISKLCSFLSINKIVLFSDSEINKNFISELEINGIEVIIPETHKKNGDLFLKLFMKYIYDASAIICNSSSLVLSISFLFHEFIYLPSKDDDFQKVFLDEAHNSYPTLLNWK